MDAQRLVFRDLILLVQVVRLVYADNDLIYTVESVRSRQHTVAVGTRLRDLHTMPEQRIRLTEIDGVGEEVRRVNSQLEVLHTIATVDALTGPLVCT